MAVNLRAMMRRAGSRRRVVKFRRIRPKPAPVRELEAINASIMDPWDAAIGRIIAAYERPGRTGFADSAEETSMLIDLIILETNRALVSIAAKVRTWGRKVEVLHRQAWVESVLSATGIDLATVLSPIDVQETVEAVIQRNVGLVRNVSDATRNRIADAVFRGVQGRKPSRDVAADIRAATDIERKRALRIAADQTTKMYAALDQARQEEAGIEHFLWRHSRKARPRADHVARDNVLYKWRAGEGPGRNPPADLPGALPYCGCQAQAVLLDENDKPI